MHVAFCDGLMMIIGDSLERQAHSHVAPYLCDSCDNVGSTPAVTTNQLKQYAMNILLVIKDFFSCKPKIDDSWKNQPLKISHTCNPNFSSGRYVQDFPVNCTQL